MSRKDKMKEIRVMSAEYKIRVEHWIRVLKEDLYEPLGEISWNAFLTREHLSLAEVKQGVFQAVPAGFTWGKEWEYGWFWGTVTLPEEAEGKRIVLNLQPGGESTLFVNGQAFGTYRSEQVGAMDEKYHFMVDNFITREGVPGQIYEIMMETYAGHDYPQAGGDICSYGPVLSGKENAVIKDGARRTLGSCTYGIWNEDAYQLYMHVETLRKLLMTLDQTSLRAVKIAEALEGFTRIVDFEQEKKKRIASYREALEFLQPVMNAENGSTMPYFYAVGNAHLDLAWLWPMEETCRKTARTFAAQLRLLEEYPEYKFIQSQPVSYEMCKKYYPELFVRVKDAVKRGQWIAEGAMWVEPDTNLSGGEALIRQLLYGKKYYREEFDVESQVLWLPDTFGYTAALPQILAGCGVKYLVTQKIFWSYNEGEQFPYHYFFWEGMDGSKVISFLPTDYTYRTDPQELNTVWKNRSQTRELTSFLLPFGYGDGGGGPARDHVEYALREKNLEGCACVKLSGPLEFFRDMEAQGGPQNTYTGELYFSAHRGTYTAQAKTKKNNRKCEFALREMEIWGTLAAVRGMKYPAEEMEALWKEVLLYQFHDILPGSCIEKVYEKTEERYRRILMHAGRLTERACTYLTETGNEESGITIFNSLGFRREAAVILPDDFEKGACLSDGHYLPVYETGEGLKAIVELPPCGCISLRPALAWKEAEDREEGMAVITETAQGFLMENALVRACVNVRGEVYSFVLKESGREFSAGKMNCLRMFKDVPRFFDAWDIDSNYIEQETEGAFNISVEIQEQGLQAVLKVTGQIGRSSYIQYIRLEKESRRLEFETEMQWRELHRLLKIAFPVNVYAENALHEMQFGYVERPAHRSDSYAKERFEVVNHKYTALCDQGHGAAVLNDCKYGISVNGNSMELTLLRASASPVMRGDNGIHRFTYAFTAWEGAFAASDVVHQGYCLNVPPVMLTGKCLDDSFLEVDKDNILVETVKLAEDGSGDIILRLYEGKKAAGKAVLKVHGGDFAAYECDMLENRQKCLSTNGGTWLLYFRAFEIKTIRLEKKIRHKNT